jgi:hypothetical protein
MVEALTASGVYFHRPLKDHRVFVKVVRVALRLSRDFAAALVMVPSLGSHCRRC